MNGAQLLGVGILGFGAYYFLRNPSAVTSPQLLTAAPGAPATPVLQPLTAAPNVLSPQAHSVVTAATTLPGPGNTPAASSFPLTAVVSGATGAAASGIAGGIGAISGGAALAGALTAGIGAGVALLAYGIIDQGWFSGGVVHTVVNPNRDKFVAQFANFDYHRDPNNPPGAYGLNLILVTVDNAQQQQLQDALRNAQNGAQLTTAINNILAVINTITPAGWAAIQAAQAQYRSGAVTVNGQPYSGV